MNKWFIGFVTFCAILSGALSGALYNEASAASAYDDLYHTTDTLTIHTNNKSPNYDVDITLHWFNYITNVSVPDGFTQQRFYSNESTLCSPALVPCGTSATIINELNAMLANEDSSWSVSMYNTNNNGGHNLKPVICYNIDEPMILQWNEWGTGGEVIVSNYDRCIYIDSNTINGMYAFRFNNSMYRTGIISNSSGIVKNLMCANCNPNYPVGYEGKLIKQTWDPPIEWDYQPNIQLVQANDWKITLQDRNFNTFDNVPFTCNEGLTPIIEYELFNNDTSELLDNGIFNPTIQYVFQSEKYNVVTQYKFIAKYNCGDSEDDPIFTHQTTFYFTLNNVGSFQPDTPSCFTEDFPYVDISGCMEVIQTVGSNLSFGAIELPNMETDSNCHTITVLGDWLNVPNNSRTICPQFSNTVRNVVTPFVTFVLGITIAGAITTKSRFEMT